MYIRSSATLQKKLKKIDVSYEEIYNLCKESPKSLSDIGDVMTHLSKFQVKVYAAWLVKNGHMTISREKSPKTGAMNNVYSVTNKVFTRRTDKEIVDSIESTYKIKVENTLQNKEKDPPNIEYLKKNKLIRTFNLLDNKTHDELFQKVKHKTNYGVSSYWNSFDSF